MMTTPSFALRAPVSMESHLHPAKAAGRSTFALGYSRAGAGLKALATLLVAAFFVPYVIAQTSPTTANLEVLVADFNHDGIPDVLIPSATSPTATIAFGTIPLGTFSTVTKAVTMPSGCILPTQGSVANGSVVAADFNGDGFADLYFTCGTSANTLATITGVMLGKGDGTFAPPVLLDAPYANSGVAGDFNHDGKMDLVLVSYPNGYYFGTNNQHPALLFFAGNGDGTFAAPVTSALGTSPTFEPGQFFFQSPVAADVDGDGYPDIILNSAYGYTTNNLNGATLTISVFGNRKDGTFGAISQATRLPDATAAVGTYPAAQDLKVLAGNFFGGALPGFAVPDTGSNAGVFLVRNSSAVGSFSLATATKATYAGLQNAAGATFTGSGFTDLLVSNGTSLNALTNDGSGNFGGSGASAVVYNGLTFPTTNTLFAAADANEDGYSDIYTASFNNSSYLALNVSLVSGTATATSAPITLPLGTTETAASWPGNLNYNGSSASGVQTVAKTVPIVTLASSQNPAPLNTPVTFTALVASATPISQVPTGVIVFTDGAATLGTVPLDGTGAATLTVATLTAAAHTIQAAYAGDDFFDTSVGALTQGITAPGQLTANLLLNPGAELGLLNGAIPYWTPAGPGSPTLDSGTFDSGINPHTGSYDFVGFNGSTDSLYQNVSLLAATLTPAMLDSGTLRAAISFWEQGLNQGTPSDDASVTLTFLDANGAALSSVTTPEVDSHNSTWQNYANTYTIPAGTRSLGYTMNFIRHAGGDLDGFVDDNSLLILAAAPVAITPILTWSPPSAIVYGTPLDATQLNAAATTASGAPIPGVYTYSPAAGTILPVGTQTLSVLFTPTDLTAFTTATATVPIDVLPAPTTTALAITSGTTPVITVAQGTAITLTATVLSGTNPITPGQVNFCDASVPYCTDIHLLGTAQLTPTGTATFKFIPGIGSHTYKAVFLGTAAALPTTSAIAPLTVTGTYTTTTTLTPSGNPGSYSLTAAVTGSGPATPSGVVSFLDSTNTNTVLGTAPLAFKSTALAFSVPAFIATGNLPLGVSPVDLNNDGKIDLLVNNAYSNTLSVLLGNGDGTFTAASSQPTGRYPSSVAIGDFNNDGKPDVAITDYFDGQLTILLGLGDGTFIAAAQPATGNDTRTVATADFNGDGILDLAVGRDNSLVILLGNGDGTFTAAAASPATGNGPNYGIATGDFNGDGKADIAVTNSGDSTLSILLGNGDGTFTAAASPATGSYPVSIAVADLNRDGKLDLAVANALGNTVTILLNNGDGTFTAAASPATDASPQSVTVGDLNGDGIADLAVTNETGKTVSILLGKGDGTFTASNSLTPGTGPDRAAIADFNGDGILDVAANDASAGGISIFLGQLTTTATSNVGNVSPIGNGTHQIVASYPGDTLYAPSASAPVPLTAQPLATILTWTPAAATIPYGTPLGPQQLNATALSVTGAPIAGTFTYTPAAGAILTAGRQTLQLVFTPISPLYAVATATQTITVTQVAPVVTWPNPAAISYGTPLSASQFNATASTPGTFTYTPASGTILPAGTRTLSLTYTPTDTIDYTATPLTLTRTLTVLPAAPTVTLAITSGTAPVTTIAQGTAITLTATVLAGVSPVTPGQVNFCDASTPYCTDIHLLGTAQLTANGTATLRFIPGLGAHTYKAVFLGTTTALTAATTASTLSVTGTHPTTTNLASSGIPGNYTLTATITASGSMAMPTRPVDFVDSTGANSVLGSASLSSPSASLTFSAPVNIATGSLPIGVVPYDLNGDGKIDLLVNNSYSGTVSILIGNGDGSFTAAPTLNTGGYPASIAVGDFNGDGEPDIAITDYYNAKVIILLGNGDGTFRSAASLATGTDTRTIVTADFNHDGILDLAVGHDNAILILLGNGDGTFTSAGTTPTGNGPNYGLATADFNGDGNADIAVTNSGDGTVSVLLGNGDGTFIAAASPAVGSFPVSIAVGDLNGDGRADLAVLEQNANKLAILLGNGDGTFTAAPSQTTGNKPQGVSLGDLNGDGIPDLAVANQNGNAVTILLGKGDGTFSTLPVASTGAAPDRAAIADFNGDGIPDLATSDVSGGGVSVLLTSFTATATAIATNVSPIGTGTHQIIASYPGDTNFASSTSTPVALTAQPLATTITWTPAVPTIPYGTPLGAQQLNAVALSVTGAPIAGTFTYTPAAGAILTAGRQTIQLVFTPTSPLYATATATQTITVTPTAPILTWPNPAAISYGTALTAAQLNATANIPGTFTYTPAAGTILPAGTQTLSATFTPTDTVDYTALTITRTFTVAQAKPILTWPTPAPIFAGTALSATQLNATAAGVTGAALPGTFTYTPAAGTVPTAGTQTLAVSFTPTDALNYTTSAANVQLQVNTFTLAAISPNTARVADPDKTITLTGTGFTTGSLAQVNGTRLATTFVNATTLTAIVPATNFIAIGTLQVAVVTPANSAVTASLPLTVSAPTPAVTLSGPATTLPGTQPALALTIANPYPIPLTATFTLTFASAVTPTVDDPSIQFASGGRTYSFTVPANSTTVPAIQLQAGTVAGTITIPLTLTAAGVNVTPATVQPVVIVVPGSVPAVSTATLTRSGAQLTVTIHGFSNTREVAQAAFHFMPATGAVIDTPDVTVPVAPIFSGWFTSSPSIQYGSSFTYTQIFNVSDTTTNIGSVQVTLTNAVGASTSYTAQ